MGGRWTRRLACGIGLALSFAAWGQAAWAQVSGRESVAAPATSSIRPRILALEVTSERDEIHLEIRWSARAEYRVTRVPSPSQVIVDLAGVAADDLLRPLTFEDPALAGIRAQPWRDGVRIVADLRYPLYEVTAAPRSDGRGLRIEISRLYRRASRIFAAPGVDYGHIRMGLSEGPVLVNYIAIDLDHAGIEVRPALADAQAAGQETVSQMSRRLGAIAAVNGIYFSSAGRPLGLVATGQRLISPPVYARTAFGWFDDGSWLMSRVDLTGHVQSGSISAPLYTVNGARVAGQVALYTPDFGYASPANDRGRTLAAVGGEVIQVNTRGPTPIPPGGYVMVCDERSPLFGLQVGDALQANWWLTPAPFNRPLRFAIGGGPRLVENGRVTVTSDAERFQPDIARGRAPRTALGVTPDRKLLLVVVNGRQEGLSVGLTLEELAGLMIELGARDAMNLDGGGSSTLVVRDRVLNMPSGGVERPVNNALLVFASQAL